jgi:hypothetical protein
VAANVAGAVVFGPPIVVEHAFWFFWGMWGYPLGLLAGEEEQVRLWHTIQVGPTYGSTLLGPHWAYYGHEVEDRAIKDAILPGGHLKKVIPLSKVDHEDGAFTCCRTSTHPIYNMGGAESRPLE